MAPILSPDTARMCHRRLGIASESVELNHRLLPRVAVAEGIDRPVQEINRVDGHPLLQDAVGLDPASPDGTRAGLHSGPREQ